MTSDTISGIHPVLHLLIDTDIKFGPQINNSGSPNKINNKLIYIKVAISQTVNKNLRIVILGINVLKPILVTLDLMSLQGRDEHYLLHISSTFQKNTLSLRCRKKLSL
jgi:hypothetical protein